MVALIIILLTFLVLVLHSFGSEKDKLDNIKDDEDIWG